MEELGLIAQTNTPAQLFIVQFTPDALGSYIALSRRLRASGFATEVSAEAKGMGKQLKYADRKGFRFALIGGPDELERRRMAGQRPARRRERRNRRRRFGRPSALHALEGLRLCRRSQPDCT